MAVCRNPGFYDVHKVLAHTTLDYKKIHRCFLLFVRNNRRKTMTYSSGDGGTAGSSNEVILRDPPTDGISAVKFGQTSNQFLVASSWDGFIRLYDIQGETRCRAKFDLGGPVLDTCFQVS